MKKQILILLAVLASVFSYGQGGFTSFAKLRLTSIPALDTVSTQILVRNGSNGNINYVPKSVFNPSLQAVTDVGNTITDGMDTNTVTANGVSVNDGTDFLEIIKNLIQITDFSNVTFLGKGFLSLTDGINEGIYLNDRITVNSVDYPLPTGASSQIATLADIQNATGWEQITDATYTSGSPLTISTGVTGKILTGTTTKIQTQLPSGVTTFWDASTDELQGANNGDAFSLSVRFKAKMNVANGYADIGINIGGTFNTITKETLVFLKGSGVEQTFDVDLNYFTGTTFISNGGAIEVTPINGNIEIYDVVLLITRTHKGK